MKTINILCVGACTATMIWLTGCTTMLLLSKSLEIKTDFDKIDKSVLIVIDSDLANLDFAPIKMSARFMIVSS